MPGADTVEAGRAHTYSSIALLSILDILWVYWQSPGAEISRKRVRKI